MTDKKKDDTLVDPFMARKRSSQNAMTAIGWVICPCCGGKSEVYCSLCWNEQDKRFDRRVPVDKAIAWKKEIGHHDTQPEMEAVRGEDASEASNESSKKGK